VLKLSASEQIPVMKLPDGATWNGFGVKGSVSLKVEFEIKPDVAVIAEKLVKKYGPQLLGKAVGEAAGTAVKAVSEIAASLPALAGIVGGYITVKSVLAALKDWDEIRQVADAAEHAVQGYAGGFSSSTGGKLVAGDPTWEAQGGADGARMLNEQVANAHAKYPQFTPEEIKGEMVKMSAASSSAVYDAVYAASASRIKETYIAKWKAERSWIDKTFGNTKGDERALRTLVTGKGDAPPSAAVPAPEPTPTSTGPDHATESSSTSSS